jgi:hypothetical protein
VDGYPPRIRTFGDSNRACNSQDPEVSFAIYGRWLAFCRGQQVVEDLYDLNTDASQAGPPEDLNVRHEISSWNAI